ncbi:MAG: N-acetylmuramoyl-L-alanine amidase [Syntrophobacterales bacterium]|jgi:N-acetylmuramoyl-L-alanine amidase|nr:N-acetylmuramoyl-L-alanine amidase [Syntrophobacterales bacterium]
MVYFLMMCCLSVWFLGTPISSECWAGDFKVAIDIGHTINTPGAISARGVPEYLFNKNIAILLHRKLIQDPQFKGSFIINETGDDLPLSARGAIANRQGAALFISIHHDSVEPKDLSYWLCQGKSLAHCDKFAGYSIYYSEENGNPLRSLSFAVVLGSEMLRNGFCPTLHHAEKFTGADKGLVDRIRGIYKYNKLVVLRTTDMPAVLFECGIIKNRYEELELSNSAYQHRIVDALLSAIKIYSGGTR